MWVRKVAAKPLPRKLWLTGRKWYRCQKKILIEHGYDKPIKRYPRHIPKEENGQVLMEAGRTEGKQAVQSEVLVEEAPRRKALRRWRL